MLVENVQGCARIKGYLLKVAKMYENDTCMLGESEQECIRMKLVYMVTESKNI